MAATDWNRDYPYYTFDKVNPIVTINQTFITIFFFTIFKMENKLQNESAQGS